MIAAKWTAVLFIPLLFCACGPSDPGDATPERLAFPDDFLFGTAIAGFQADMGCPTLAASECDDPGSDWYAFATSPEMIAESQTHLSGQSPSNVGPGYWELYESDLDRAASELGNNGLRFSLEWSRIFPQTTEGVTGYDALRAIANPAALGKYHAMLAAMKSRGISPLVTLNHYTLPAWIHDAIGCHKDLDTCSPRGWLDKDRTLVEIAKYAAFAAQEFGGEVDRWVTLNEPFAVLFPGYLFPTADRSNPPAVSLRFAEAKQVWVALVEAHARMYDAVKAADTADADGDGTISQVGVVYSMAPVIPADPEEPLDVKAAENVFYLYNMVYLNGVAKGDLDEDLDGTPVHRADLEGRMDYIGINYYTRITVHGTTDAFLPELSPLSTFNPLTMKLWEDYPRGIYEMAMVVKNDLGLPAIITENGVAQPADDDTGPSFLVRHLSWLSRAVADGADVRGYFFWSLMDNFEWNHGMDMHFGLYAVDKDDPQKTRTPRRTADAYSRIVQARQVPPDLAARFPAPR